MCWIASAPCDGRPTLKTPSRWMLLSACLPSARRLLGVTASIVAATAIWASSGHVSPTTAMNLFPKAGRIVATCELIPDQTVASPITAAEFCETVKLAIESMAQGKISPKVTQVTGWTFALDPGFAARCKEAATAIDPAVCDRPAGVQVLPSQSHVKVKIVERESLKEHSNPSVLILRYVIRIVNDGDTTIISWNYQVIYDREKQSLSDMIADLRIRLFLRWPGAVVFSEGKDFDQKLIDEIQFTLAHEIPPYEINNLNQRQSNP